MATIAQHQVEVTGGVGTHKETHTAGVVDSAGRILGSALFPATETGYAALLAWLCSFGTLVLAGIEGTGAYGAGLARHLHRAGVPMVEVDRPDRKARRRQGKSDPVDAEAAARSALAQIRTGQPKHRDGQVEALRNLRVARRSAIKQRADTQRQIKTLIVTAPETVRDRLRGLPSRELVKVCAAMRPDPSTASDPATAVKIALRSLARRHHRLTSEINELDQLIKPLIEAINPALLQVHGVGPEVAAQLSW